ncbi:hypothetical protein UC34_13820 [Pandoraea vervacti]|uniref:Uncharacterized protein n=1 Tax=Pandoraea vervacti TaxID=656178 RepID=A0ABN4FPZ6_9BURK|nr:hypothetical protein [Pandoraea vervacti]AJP57767.1 hypothetical protein UC34_13820 [Pandoraea vervacti]
MIPSTSLRLLSGACERVVAFDALVRFRRALACLWAALALGSGSGTACAASGADVAQWVSQRYASRVEKCAVDRAIWMCSGLIVRPLAGGASQNFAALTVDEAQNQSVNLVFVRGDLRTSSLGATAGFILADGFTAAGWGKPYDVRCVYPFEVSPPGAAGSHGCDLLGSAPPVPPDWSSCAANGVTDATAWVAHFNANGQNVLRQCSLSAHVAPQFYAAMQAHEQATDALAQTAMSLLSTAWNPAAPATIPVQAFYYDVGTPGQLMQAQRYQMQYFNAMREWVPILRVAFTPGQGAAFGYDETDQLEEGYRVAERLTNRYADTSPNCNGGTKAAYFCDGVIIRMVSVAQMPIWNPHQSYINRDGVSASYMRADAKVTQLATGRGGTGFIFKELNAPAGQQVIVKCSFPANANTNARPDSCFNPGQNRYCDSLGVTTYPAWTSSQCPFSVTPAQFNLSVTVRRDYAGGVGAWNEITIKPWPPNIPARLPLEAFVAVGDAYVDARTIQLGYFNATARFLPIIRVNATAAPGLIFTYVPGDQVGAQQ